jgi:pimeloyl-ACP methyl ester carboxylesterase
MRLRRLNKWVRRLIFLGIGLFLAYLCLCWIMATEVISPKRVIPVRPKSMVEWETSPGTMSWASPSVVQGKADTVFVMAHGLLAQQDFWAELGQKLQDDGYGVVIPPMPGQGTSPLKSVGFGVTEAQVVRETIDKIKAKHIILMGCSMGGAAVWLASDHPRVDAVITEGAYGRLEPVTRYWFERKSKGGAIIFRPVIWMASWRIGKSPSAVNPVETAAKFKKPALVIQCSGDNLIPMEQAKELAQVSGAEYWEIPDLKHAHGQDVGG